MVAAVLSGFGVSADEVADHVRQSVVEVGVGRRGNGAGTIWRRDGLIATNFHVVSGPGARVKLANGRVFEGRTVAQDRANDLALLRIPADELPAANVGDARRLRAGELVVAIGHPYGNVGTLTVGVVSSSLADRDHERELVRASVLLGPGNSGGPLADSRGRVVGINAMVAGGLALAVPSHLVERLVSAPARPKIGIEAKDVELSVAHAALAGVAARRGILVVGIKPGSPAERGGLLIGDLVITVADTPVEGLDGLVDALAADGGGPVRLGIVRGGNARDAWVVLEEIAEKAA